MNHSHRCSGIRKPETALGAIIQFAKLVQGQAFSPEEAIAWGAEIGIAFDDQRAWGCAFRDAAKQGFIRRAGLFARSTSNGSVRPGWILA